MKDDDTLRMPQPTQPAPPAGRYDPNPYRHERLLLTFIGIAYLLAGAVLGFALMQLAYVVDQIHDTPLCRRI